MIAWMLVVIGLLFSIFGIGGSAKMHTGIGGIVVTAGAGVILMIVGVILWSAGI